MSTTLHTLARLALLVGAAAVALVGSAVAAAMPLVPEGDPPIKVRPVHHAAESTGAIVGGGSTGGIDWATAAVSAAYAAEIVLVVLGAALAVVRARSRRRTEVPVMS